MKCFFIAFLDENKFPGKLSADASRDRMNREIRSASTSGVKHRCDCSWVTIVEIAFITIDGAWCWNAARPARSAEDDDMIVMARSACDACQKCQTNALELQWFIHG